MQTIDRLFIATNVEIVELEENPDLCRYVFYEIIVRMAGAKFKESGRCHTWDEATSRLISEKILPNMETMGG